ncbi:LOW QUALITY PROTEIN: Protein CBG08129 [Caenorhabditis briggsae]|uniref:Protein CBG08129 n=1 Tax=Caenorhabditis briggsae TaxID=6238 RepID=A8X5V9_CAEBR|nr:LOW QUALITY PROTEIN: Protein CBG08129 [Caenorhabditis briggsae]CAP28020.1 Protein CBG08129 [Caenorhabditis briggsae]
MLKQLFCVLVIIGLLIKKHQATDYDQYDYDWLTAKPRPEASTPSSTKSPDDDDVIVDQLDNRKAVGEISGGFSNEKSFSCPHAKPMLHTGESVAQLSPEDIRIVGAMGDSLASGRGLWPFTDVEFRGAAFPIGGDANMDGLVTLPNILSQFVPNLEGISHGMGSKSALPDYQFNVAEIGAETEDLPQQALELVHRIQRYVGRTLKNKWALITIVTGSEEFCEKCEPPSRTSIRRALGVLRRGLPKALIVLLGPVHVASTYRQNINLMRPRCKCLEKMTGSNYRNLFDVWKTYFVDLENEFNTDNGTFGVLSIPSLAIHSRNPQSLLVPGKPLLNRKGHSYAAKWLWNRLIAGPNYNISLIALSEDTYYCPSLGCPYIRTVQNFKSCTILTEEKWRKQNIIAKEHKTGKEARQEVIRTNLAGVIAVILGLSMLSVFIFGTYFYCHGLKATKGRFDFGQTTTELEIEQQEEK